MAAGADTTPTADPEPDLPAAPGAAAHAPSLLDDLERQLALAGELQAEVGREIEREQARMQQEPWSALRYQLGQLGQRVLPLSLKDDAATPDERYRAGLQRRMLRLHRESTVLRQQAEHLREQGARLQA